MILLVRDEADIVRENIDYHLQQGVDGIVAIDNGSIDGTREILEEYQSQGVLSLIDETGRDYSQSDWVTRAAIHARDLMGADWVLSNDADEFWTTSSGNIKNLVQNSRENALMCERVNMLTSPDRLADQDWINSLVYRVDNPVPKPKLNNIYTDPLECPYLYLALPGKVLARTKNLVRISQGNHNAIYGDQAITAVAAPVKIFHFPVRSRFQFEKKVVQGGLAYQQNVNFSEGVGWHWRRWYQLLLTSGIEALLADALPSEQKLDADLSTGAVVEDCGLRDALRASAKQTC